MRKLFCVIFASLFASFVSFGQTTAVVEISLQNTPKLRIERPTFFEKTSNYKLTKLNDDSYKLEYLSDKPGILLLNSRSIFITPGDNVKLIHKVILRTTEVYRDTLIATGTNRDNYTFSNFTERRRPNEPYPEFSDKKYKNNMNRFYDELVGYFSSRDQYIAAKFSKGDYSKDLIAYIKRKQRLDFLSNMVYFEGLTAQKYPDQLPEFSRKLESDFRSTVFLPSDTGYTRRMEEIFKNYLYHLVYVKCNGVDSSVKFEKLISYIQAYPDLFVREYLLCFLVTDYTDNIWRKYKTERSVSLIREITNPAIRMGMKKYLE